MFDAPPTDFAADASEDTSLPSDDAARRADDAGPVADTPAADEAPSAFRLHPSAFPPPPPSSALATTKRGKSRALKRPPTKRAIIDSGGVLTSRPHGVKFTHVQADAPYAYRPALYDGVLFWTNPHALGLFSLTDIALHLATLIPALQAPVHEAVYINHDGTPFLTVTWEELRSRGRDGWTVTVVSVDSDVFSRVFIPRSSGGGHIADALRTAAVEVIEKGTTTRSPGTFRKEPKRPRPAHSGRKGRRGGKLARKASAAQFKALPPGGGGNA